MAGVHTVELWDGRGSKVRSSERELLISLFVICTNLCVCIIYVVVKILRSRLDNKPINDKINRNSVGCNCSTG